MFQRYLPFISNVTLVAYQYLGHLFIHTVCIYSFDPLLNIFISIFVCKIKANNDSFSFFVKIICQLLKSFLSSCIPDFDIWWYSALGGVLLWTEVQAQGCDMLFSVLVEANLLIMDVLPTAPSPRIIICTTFFLVFLLSAYSGFEIFICLYNIIYTL